MTENYLAIIPARKGSKRLPNKNILSLAGKPLIVWTIEAALAATKITKVIVSTDSEEIAEIAQKAGAEVPFIRPDYLSNDTATSVDVIIHSLNFYKSQKTEINNFVLLQPTSPLRTSADIDAAINLHIKRKANSVTSVCEMEHSPLWSNTLPDNHSMEYFLKPEIVGKRSQDLDKYYRLNGAIYICNVRTFLKEKTFISKNKSFAYIMKKEHAVDIDDDLDFEFANYLLLKKQNVN